MSDDIERRAVELAIAAAGQVGSDERGWQIKIAKVIPLIATMMRPPAQGHEDLATTPYVTARKVLDATVFRAEFVGFTVEEKTKRLIVQVRSDTSDDKDVDADGVEEMRTEPWWTNAGWVMRKAIENLAPGTPINVFKVIEQFDGADDRGKKMTKSSRVLVHFEVTGKPRSDIQTAGTTPPSRQAERPATQQAPAPAGSPHPDENHAVIAERFEQLTARQRVAFGHLCRAQGLTDFMNPSDEHLDAVLVNLSSIERGV